MFNNTFGMFEVMQWVSNPLALHVHKIEQYFIVGTIVTGIVDLSGFMQ